MNNYQFIGFSIKNNLTNNSIKLIDSQLFMCYNNYIKNKVR